MVTRKVLGQYFLPIAVAAAYLFLYIPIFVVILFSFNSNPHEFTWTGFTTRWYGMLLEEIEVWEALRNSLLVAFSSVTLSLVLSVLFIFYGTYSFLGRAVILFYTNLAAPEIVLAAGMVSFFMFFSVPLGIPTLIVGHTLIGLGYAVPILSTRYLELSEQYVEASMDLGATHAQALRTVIIPLLSPALAAAGLLVFIISLDDFVLSFFCAGPATSTLPIYIFAILRSGSSPMVGVLSTLLITVTSMLVLVFSLLRVKKLDMVR